MSTEQNRPGHTWGDEPEQDETEASRAFRTSYPNPARPQRQPPRSNDTSQGQPPQTPPRPGTRALPRGVPGAAHIYEERDEPPATQDPRTTHEAHKKALARLRQRPRQSGEYPSQSMRPQSSDPGEYPARPAQAYRNTPGEHPSQPLRPRREQMDDYPYQQSGQNISRDPRWDDRRRDRYREEGTYERHHEEEVRRGHSGRERHEGEEAHKTAHRRRDRDIHPQHHRRQGERRRNGSCIVAGCLGGLLTLAVIVGVGAYFLLHNTPIGQNIGKSAHTQQTSQSLALGNASELIVKNQVGNVLIKVDTTNTGSSANLSSVKTVYAGSSSEADSLFRKIVLSAQPVSQGADPACTTSSCLLITATLPANTSNGGLLGGIGPSMDLMLTLPGSFNTSDPTSPHMISASTVSGNLAVNGFNGILNLTGDSSKISVTHALIFAGTCLQTMQGDISVDTGTLFDLAQSSPLVPCSHSSNSSAHPWFYVSSGKGNVEITLSAPSTNLLLDANTNNGKISNDFGLNIPSTNDGSASYHGPLLPHSTPRASLYVVASTGNITIHKG